MKIVKTYIFETEKPDEVPVRDMNQIFNQVDNNAVGIHAGNMFTLGYGTIAPVICSIFTEYGKCHLSNYLSFYM